MWFLYTRSWKYVQVSTILQAVLWGRTSCVDVHVDKKKTFYLFPKEETIKCKTNFPKTGEKKKKKNKWTLLPSCGFWMLGQFRFWEHLLTQELRLRQCSQEPWNSPFWMRLRWIKSQGIKEYPHDTNQFEKNYLLALKDW